MAKRIGLIAFALVIALAIVFTGCTPARRPDTTGQNNNGMTTSYGNNDRGYQGTDQYGSYNNYTKVGDELGIRDWTDNYTTGLNDGRVGYFGGNTMGNYNGNTQGNAQGNTIGTNNAESLARACEQVQGVENATVVVTGNTAYCGIDLDTNGNVANERDIKNSVAERIRATNNNINTVYVSAEADFMDRLRNVGDGLRNGRPVDAFTTELNQMIQRMSPTRW